MNKLYNSKNFDTEINGVEFHKLILGTCEYFERMIHFNSKEILTFPVIISYETTILFKKFLYEQELQKDLVITPVLIIETFILSDAIQIDLFRKLKPFFQNFLNSDSCSNQDKNIILQNTTSFGILTNITIDEKELDETNPIHLNLKAFFHDRNGNKKEAFRLYKLNWEENKNIDSCNNLAHCYYTGNGCNKDQKEAFRLFKLNWEENKNIDSCYNLAYCYYTGNGCNKDQKEAFRLFKLNWEENKHSESCHNLAICYYNGEGCNKDQKEAFRLFKLNWEENKNSRSCNTLAHCYYNGRGCDKNEKEAFRLFKLNWEENKNSNSCHSLAVLYNNGKGCDKNLEKYNYYMALYNSTL